MNRLVAALGIIVLVVCGNAVTPVFADELKSAHFEFDQSVIGGGGLTQENSAHFQAGEFIGDLAIGNSASSNFQLNSGFDTTGEPALTFVIDSAAVNFGSFSPAVASVAISTFEVIDYTSYGYIVQIYGGAPTNGSHTIAPLASADVSQAGVEQFGINLVANTSPVPVGANPSNSIFGVGQAAANYNTPDHYRFVNGDTIAYGPKSSGDTLYTISYLINVSSITPGGQYSSGQTLICVGTY